MRIAISTGVSVLVHLILAAGLWWYFTAVPGPVVLAQLDLTSVELSLAEEDVATAMPMSSLPAVAEQSDLQQRPDAPSHPEPIADLSDPMMPALDEPRAPEAAPSVPDLPEVGKQVRSESSGPVTPAVAPKQAKIEAPPSLKRAIRPDYPRGARMRKEEGDVVLEIHVADSGDVTEVRVVTGSGFTELDEAAVRAARAARFTPAKSGAEAVASVARLKLAFKLK